MALILVASVAPAPAIAQTAPADSIVLERTSGFSRRPPYRVSVARDGVIRFTRQPAPRDGRAGVTDLGATARDSVGPAHFARLLRLADRSGFAHMPAEIGKDRALCPVARTDAGSAIITIHRPRRAKRVDVYLGCLSAPGRDPVRRVRRLLAIADAIDTVAGTRRRLGS